MKGAVVSLRSDSDWVSCQSIIRNLVLSYQSIYNIEINHYGLSKLEHNDITIAEKIVSDQLDFVSIVDHRPDIFNFISFLSDKNFKGICYIHVFGDYVLFLDRFAHLTERCRNLKFHFVAASKKQASIVEKTLMGASISVVPFPVQPSMKFDSKKRINFRDKFGIKDEKVFVYTGRLTFQKNVILLKEYFQRNIKKIIPDAKLFIAGFTDDIGYPYLGKQTLPGSFFYSWQKHASPFDNIDIVFLGNLKSDQLQELYCGSDVFMSFSTYHDEDYGMSPAESLMCGLPLVLSDWGGYSSFKKIMSDHVVLCEVNSDQNIEINRKLPSILNLLSQSVNREQRSIQAAEKLSIEAVAQMLNIIISEKRSSDKNIPSDLARRVIGAFAISKRAPFKNSSGGYSETYRLLYSSYYEVSDE